MQVAGEESGRGSTNFGQSSGVAAGSVNNRSTS